MIAAILMMAQSAAAFSFNPDSIAKMDSFNMERNAPQFLYFRPVDDWTPEPPEPPKAAEPE